MAAFRFRKDLIGGCQKISASNNEEFSHKLLTTVTMEEHLRTTWVTWRPHPSSGTIPQAKITRFYLDMVNYKERDYKKCTLWLERHQGSILVPFCLVRRMLLNTHLDQCMEISTAIKKTKTTLKKYCIARKQSLLRASQSCLSDRKRHFPMRTNAFAKPVSS